MGSEMRLDRHYHLGKEAASAVLVVVVAVVVAAAAAAAVAVAVAVAVVTDWRRRACPRMQRKGRHLFKKGPLYRHI